MDVGASYGSYTLTACAMGAFVHAFEPERTVYADLVANLELNGWRGRRAIAYPVGLWDSEGKVNMASYAPHWPKQTISGEYDVVRMDGFGWPEGVDWIKVDVEGAEGHVLQGARGTIEKFHPKMLIECHTFLDEWMVNKVKALLPDGYRFEEIGAIARLSPENYTSRP